MTMTTEQITEICEALIGTAQTIGETLESHGFEDNDENHEDVESAMDSHGFECQSCNWWCEFSEHHKGDLCGDCMGDDDE